MAFTTHGIELPDPGSDTDTWGDILNDDTFPMLVKLVLGNEAMSLTTNKTLTSTNGVDNEARNFWLVFSDGGLSAVPTVTIPGVEKVYIVSNTGSTYAITMTAGGVTGSIPAGRTCLVRCDGTDVVVVDFVGLASNEPLDSAFRIKGSSDATKKVAFEVDGLPTATTRTLTVPDKSGTLAVTSDLAGMTLLGTLTTTSGTTQSLTDIPAGYRQLYCEVDGVSFTGSVTMTIALSSTNGAAFGTARNISGPAAAGGLLSGFITVFNVSSTIAIAKPAHALLSTAAGATAAELIPQLDTNTAAVVNAIQFAGGTFDAGTIRIYGVK